MKLYDVVIVEDSTNEIVAVIGKDMNERQMEKRIETGIGRCNMQLFHVKEVEAGKGVVGQKAV